MTAIPSVVGPSASVLNEFRARWGWFMTMGVFLIVCGTFALTWSFAAALVTAVIFGWLLIFAGVVQTMHAFVRRRWGGIALDVLIGVLYIVVGFMTVAEPAATAITLTLLIAVLLIIGGISRIVLAIAEPLPHRGWVLLNGLITLALGIMIWRQWPLSGLWVIGTFIGIEMILSGWSFVMLSLAARKFPAAPSTAAVTA